MLTPTNAAVACDADGIARAAAALRAGQLVGLPTETVYGLAADAGNPAAVSRIFAVKGRPADHPLIVHLADAADVDDWAQDIPDYARQLAARLWPGPLTLVLPARDETSRLLTGGQDTVGLRVPAHPAAHAVIASAGAVAAPSANRFGRVSPTRAADVAAELGGALEPGDLVLDGGDCSIGIESTIVDCTGDRPRVLRPGFYSDELITQSAAAAPESAAAEDRRAAGAVASTASTQPRVSGSLPGHYAPATPVRIIDAADLATITRERLQEALVITPRETAPPSPAAHVVEVSDDLDYARMLYGALRQADELGVAEVIAVAPRAEGIGVAILDRLSRAEHGSNGADR
ncbi:MAG: threonylcarbamoyl-AMP synthase [Actinomycetales bacterium]|nr:threonylcarbamoyl-AMP synthase [Actinomycetales bacterium]